MDPKSCLVRLKHQSFFTTEIITEIKNAVWSSELNTEFPIKLDQLIPSKWGTFFRLSEPYISAF